MDFCYYYVSPFFIVHSVGLLQITLLQWNVFFFFLYIFFFSMDQPHFSQETFRSRALFQSSERFLLRSHFRAWGKKIFALLGVAPISTGHVWSLLWYALSMGIPAVLPNVVISGEMDIFFNALQVGPITADRKVKFIYKALYIHWGSSLHTRNYCI